MVLEVPWRQPSITLPFLLPCVPRHALMTLSVARGQSGSRFGGVPRVVHPFRGWQRVVAKSQSGGGGREWPPPRVERIDLGGGGGLVGAERQSDTGQ